MPRGRMPIAFQIETLAILGQDGTIDPALDPKIDPHSLKRIYRAMLLARRWDERMVLLARQGRIGNYPPFRGQEAACLGPAFAMRKYDWLIPSFRETSAMLYLGWPMEKLILGWWGGHEYGASPPAGVNVLPLCGPVASQCLHAAGLAWGEKLKGTDRVAVLFLGDGATSEGDFHEAMNVSGVFRLPLVVVVQNNQWAISMARECQTASQTLAQKALAYGFGGMQVDGNDVLAMIVASNEAIDRARSGGGPTLIEALTYRLGPHSTSDNPDKYRSASEVDAWQQRDPLIRFRRYLRDRGILTDAIEAMLIELVEQEIASAIRRAEAYVSDPSEPFHHCLAQMPDYLCRQLGEFQRDSLGANVDAPQAVPVLKEQTVPRILLTPTRPVHSRP